MEGKCLACGQQMGHYDSKWYDKDGNIFCSHVNHIGEPEKFRQCIVDVEVCYEAESYVVYYNGKLHLVKYYTDG
jgi:hypothetical protein